MRKFAFIIDTYPNSKDEIDALLENLKKIKVEGIEIILTSHHPLTSEIIETVDYFIFEKKNDFHFLESEILNGNIGSIKDTIFKMYYILWDDVYNNRVIQTGWSVSVVSQLFNSIKFAHSKGYDFAFHLISDFKFPPDGFYKKIEDIFEKMGSCRNYFIQDYHSFPEWYAPFFYGFTIDQDLIDRIPNLDFSDFSTYQRYFCNCGYEDVILKLWSGDKNFVDDHSQLNLIFGGPDSWNTVKSINKENKLALVFECSSDIYVSCYKNDPGFSGDKYYLYLYNGSDFPGINIRIDIFDESGEMFYHTEQNLMPGTFYREVVDGILADKKSIRLYKRISVIGDESIYIEDSINIDIENIEPYSRLKNFHKI